MERISFASFWRVTSTADTGARSAVWRILSAYRWFSENRSVSFMRWPVSHIMGGVEIFSSKAFWTSILMYALFSPHINQLLATSRVSYKSTLFQHYLPGNSVRFYTLRIKSQRTSPQPLLHFRHQSQVQVVTCIYDWLAVHQRFPHPLLGFDSFARAAYRNERNI